MCSRPLSHAHRSSLTRCSLLFPLVSNVSLHPLTTQREGGEDHYSQDANRGGPCTEKNVDLSRNGVPCFGENGTSDGLWSGDDARYNGFRFTDAAVEIIMNWTATDPPMFMYYAVHNTHSPTQAPERIQAQYSHIPWPLQQVFDAMVTTVDETAKNVTDALKTKGMWDNTLFIWCTGAVGSPTCS